MNEEGITTKILSYIEKNLNEELTLEKIAKELNYSRFYAARKFKKDTGITMYQYIRGRRLDEAAAKLAGTKRPVLEIALEAGYGSQQAFTQAFRNAYEYTPQEYRRIGIFMPRQNRIEMRMKNHCRRFLAGRTEGRAAA